MSFYLGKHAQLYDIFYSDKDYAAEAFFIHDCLQSYSPYKVKNILELAGGTGEHANYLSKLGYHVHVTDVSKDMLATAFAKYKDNTMLAFEYWDMSQPKTFDKKFDAAICLFDAIGYVKTNEKLRKTLKNVFGNIREEGLFILEFWNAGCMLKNYDPVRVKRFNADGLDIVRISETSIDYSNQTAIVKYTITINGEKTEVISETQTNRYFLMQEMEGYLNEAGFRVIKCFAGYTNNTKIDIDTWHTVLVAQKTVKN